MQGSRRPGAEYTRSSLLKDEIWDVCYAEPVAAVRAHGYVGGQGAGAESVNESGTAVSF